MIKTAAFFAVVLLFSVQSVHADALAEKKALLVKNVIDRLVTTDLDSYVEIVGVTEKGDRVLAKAVAGKDLLAKLKGSKDFGRDIFKTGMSHKGCQFSFRQRTNPSLQIIFCKDKLGVVSYQIDIDRYAPLWDRPLDVARHMLLESGKHLVMQKVFKRRNAQTSQKHIANELAKEKLTASK